MWRTVWWLVEFGIGHGIYGYIDWALYVLGKMCYVANSVKWHSTKTLTCWSCNLVCRKDNGPNSSEVYFCNAVVALLTTLQNVQSFGSLLSVNNYRSLTSPSPLPPSLPGIYPRCQYALQAPVHPSSLTPFSCIVPLHTTDTCPSFHSFPPCIFVLMHTIDTRPSRS